MWAAPTTWAVTTGRGHQNQLPVPILPGHWPRGGTVLQEPQGAFLQSSVLYCLLASVCCCCFGLLLGTAVCVYFRDVRGIMTTGISTRTESCFAGVVRNCRGRVNMKQT